MKKVNFVYAVFFFFSIFLIGCENPSGSDTEGKGAPGQINLTIAQEKGAVILSWDSVIGAERYAVYRKNDSGANVRLGETWDQYYFIDRADNNNELRQGEEYTYTVAAIGYNGDRREASESIMPHDIPAKFSGIGLALDVKCSLVKMHGSAENNGITISWNRQAIMNAYNVRIYKGSKGRAFDPWGGDTWEQIYEISDYERESLTNQHVYQKALSWNIEFGSLKEGALDNYADYDYYVFIEPWVTYPYYGVDFGYTEINAVSKASVKVTI
jgi:hypothetical protein